MLFLIDAVVIFFADEQTDRLTQSKWILAIQRTSMFPKSRELMCLEKITPRMPPKGLLVSLGLKRPKRSQAGEYKSKVEKRLEPPVR